MNIKIITKTKLCIKILELFHNLALLYVFYVDFIKLKKAGYILIDGSNNRNSLSILLNIKFSTDFQIHRYLFKPT